MVYIYFDNNKNDIIIDDKMLHLKFLIDSIQSAFDGKLVLHTPLGQLKIDIPEENAEEIIEILSTGMLKKFNN